MAFVVFLSATLMALILVPPLIRVAHRLGIVDAPGSRKVHTLPVPRIGGLAMVLATAVPVLVWLELDAKIASYLAGVLVIALFGIWDDWVNLDYRLKFAGQFVAACIPVFWGDVVIYTIPFASVVALPDYIAHPLTLFFLVGIINAVNLSDGLDGLAAGVAMLSLIVIGVLAGIGEAQYLLIISMAICGSIFGFLRYNTHPAIVFMGDTGSQFLGYSLGVLTVILTQSANTALSPVLLVLVLGLPILDTASVIYQRLRAGRSPFSPDKNHLHHKLLACGLHHYEAVTAIYLLQGLFLAAAVFMRYESDALLLLIYVAICLMVFLFISLMGRSNNNTAQRPWRFSGLTRAAHTIRQSPLLLDVPLAFLSVAVPAFLLFASFSLSKVPKDFGIMASAFSVLLILRLWFGYRLWFIFLRLMIFVAIAFTVYLQEAYPAYSSDLFRNIDLAFFGLIALALVLAVRYRMSDQFRVTPSDFLLILAMLSLGMMPESLRETYHLIPVAVKLVILFYCAELILKTMKSRLSPLPLAALASLLVLGVRGLT